MFEACKELTFCLERFKASLECMTRGSIMNTSLRMLWKKMKKKVCQKILDLADELLYESGLGCQQEDRLKPLRTALERFAELAWRVKVLSWNRPRLS
jgi:hypothetical protein